MPRIDINADCIARAKRGHATEDPVAIAARMAGLPGAVVTPAGLKVADRIIDLPDDVCNFVADWDAGRSVRPIAFDVPPLDGPGWGPIGVRRGRSA